MPIFRKIFHGSYPLRLRNKTINITLNRCTWLRKLSNKYHPVYYAGGMHDQYVLLQARKLLHKNIGVLLDTLDRDRFQKAYLDMLYKGDKIINCIETIKHSPIYNKEHYMLGYNELMLTGRALPAVSFIGLSTLLCPAPDMWFIHTILFLVYRGLLTNLNIYLGKKGYFQLRQHRLEYERNINILKDMIKAHGMGEISTRRFEFLR